MRTSYVTEGGARVVMLGLVVLALLGLDSFVVGAQSRKAIKRKPAGQPASEMGIGDLYALVVGVSDYQHPKIPQLRVSDKDARDIAEFLKKQTRLFKNVHITLLTNRQATKQALEKQLFYKLRKAGKDDSIIVFLSGHGADDPNTPGEFFFLTHDADPEFLAATAVHMNRQWFLTKLESKRIVLIADACHSGGFSSTVTKALRRSREKFMSFFKESQGKIFITSSRPDQFSIEKPEYGHSLFTHYLLKGMGGRADENQDGMVTLNELYEYVYRQTHAESNGNQSPQMEGRLVGAFPISLASLHPPQVVRYERPSASQQPLSELDVLRAAAERGDAKAQFKLGIVLEFGINVASDKAEAIKWYQRAADRGSEEARKAIARLLPGPAEPPTRSGTRPRARASVRERTQTTTTHRPRERAPSNYLKEVQDFMGYKP